MKIRMRSELKVNHLCVAVMELPVFALILVVYVSTLVFILLMSDTFDK